MRTIFARGVVFLISLFICLSVHADNNQNDSIRFRPQPGQHVEYALQMRSNIEAKTSYGTQKASMRGVALMSYTIQAVTETTAQILIKPKFLEISSSGMGGMDFSSQEFSDSDERALLARDGFIFDIDLSSGKVLSMQAVNQQAWKEFVSYKDEQKLKELLQQQFVVPTVAQAIPAQEGASIVLENFQGLKNLTLTVDKIEGDQALLTLTAQGRQSAFARMIVNRQTGWPIELTFLSHVPMAEGGAEISVRTALFMKQGSQSFSSDTLPLYVQPSIGPFTQMEILEEVGHRVFDPGVDNQPQLGKADAVRNDVFPQEIGFFSVGKKGLSLNYVNNLERVLNGDDFKIEQLTLLDSQGQVLPINLLNLGALLFDERVVANYLMFQKSDGEKMQSSLAQVKARLSYYPTEVERITLPVLAGKPTQVKTERVLIELTPTDQPNTYHLSYTLPVKSWLNPYYLPGAGEGTTIDQTVLIGGGLPWLSPMFASLMNYTTLDLQRTYDYQLNFETLPKQLTFYVGHPASQAAYSQEIVFIDETSYSKNIQLPPQRERTSYKLEMIQEDDIEKIELEGGGKVHFLRFNMPALNGAGCELKIVEGPLINGEPLKWSKTEQDSGDPYVQWQLSTADQVIYYFYGMTVKTELMCSGQLSWEDIAYERHAKQPWLLDLTQLPGYVMDVKQPASILYDQFRFLNARGEVLLPRQLNAPEQLMDEKELLNLPVEAFLVDGRYLLMAGVPTKIKQKIRHDNTYKKEWVTYFDPIVCESGDLACPE